MCLLVPHKIINMQLAAFALLGFSRRFCDVVVVEMEREMAEPTRLPEVS